MQSLTPKRSHNLNKSKKKDSGKTTIISPFGFIHHHQYNIGILFTRFTYIELDHSTNLPDPPGLNHAPKIREKPPITTNNSQSGQISTNYTETPSISRKTGNRMWQREVDKFN